MYNHFRIKYFGDGKDTPTHICAFRTYGCVDSQGNNGKIYGREIGLIRNSNCFSLWSFAAGPLYAGFPIAIILMKKGAKFSKAKYRTITRHKYEYLQEEMRRKLDTPEGKEKYKIRKECG